MRFKFIGNGNSDPESIEMFGIVFELGKAVEVTSEEALAKLSTNHHFQAVKTAVRRRGRPRKKNVGDSSGTSDEGLAEAPGT